MNSLIFAISNTDKFETAKATCDHYGIALTRQNAEITEIQEEDSVKIAVDKAQKAYQMLKQPVVITDDSWAFSGLLGFPGAYMHSMNEWLTAEDFLRLAAPLTDRQVTFTINLVYTDGNTLKTFQQLTNGTLLTEARGKSQQTNLRIISLDGDSRLSIAEAFHSAVDKSTRDIAQIWHDFADWYTKI